MRGNRRRDTRPEVRLRSSLHRRGLRFRRDYPVRVAGRRPVRVDIAFPRGRLAVMVDGCFWHRCPDHGTSPGHNAEYWERKLQRNVKRDVEVDAALRAAGWRVLRIWEHEAVPLAVGRVQEELARPG